MQYAWKNTIQHMTKLAVESKRPRGEEIDPGFPMMKPLPSQRNHLAKTHRDICFILYLQHLPSVKKVDIAIHESSIAFINPISRAIEATIQLSSMQYAFILPTRGKQKPHWSIILLSSDTPDQDKSPVPTNSQIIFGVDAATISPMTMSTYSGAGPTKSTLPKGSPTISAIRFRT
ncbi:hypothetical protein BD779DRAFT_903613 [Infundibulicybe gibba]|nr:hypothetical protein BD779DRAFT_903613 [Infundibulicybe gibba]